MGEASDYGPRYTPWLKGVYDVTPGLRPLGTDFGNGEWDTKVFQLSPDADRLLAAKRVCLRERRGKYVRAFRLAPAVKRVAIETIANRLAEEYPERFRTETEGNEVVLVSGDIRWSLTADRREDSAPALDLLARLVPEDLAIVLADGEIDWLAYAHICAPSHWGVEDKVGRSFAEVHLPVPGFVRPAPMPRRMVEAMTARGPWVRFVWAVESDDRPNHHPTPPPDEDPTAWQGRQFSTVGQFWVRVERQCIVPLPDVNAALFTIRLSWIPGGEVVANPIWRDSLLSALSGMTPEEQEYKGLAADFDGLLRLVS